MRALVWTNWAPNAESPELGKPKCIFIGDVKNVPQIGSYIVVRDGFCANHVTAVIHDFVTDELEITVACQDTENEYGPCLFGESKND